MSWIETTLSIIISFLLLGGCFMIFAGILGIIRFPDLYCRMHAATKGPTLGMIMVMLAAVLFFATAGGDGNFFYSRPVLVILFIMLTNPVGAHMLSKNAYKAGVAMWQRETEESAAEPAENS